MSGHDSNISARDRLLVWSRRMVAGYPGVSINDFTHSWRDGLAFLAIIHRHRYVWNMLPTALRLDDNVESTRV